MCEEFPGLTPAQAEALLDDDGDRVMEIIGIRVYTRAFNEYQRLDRMNKRDRERVAADPIVAAVIKNDAVLVNEGDDGEPDAG